MATVHIISTPAATNRIKVHIVKIPVASASTSDTLVKEFGSRGQKRHFG